MYEFALMKKMNAQLESGGGGLNSAGFDLLSQENPRAKTKPGS
jgi:hypothetical protein